MPDPQLLDREPGAGEDPLAEGLRLLPEGRNPITDSFRGFLLHLQSRLDEMGLEVERIWVDAGDDRGEGQR